MPDLTGFPALDVAIGLAFLFFLLSTACSAINEAIAASLGWRAKTLEDGLARMLGDPKRRRSLLTRLKSAVGLVERPPTRKADAEDLGDLTSKVLAHWSIAGLVRDPEARSRRRARPSYLPPDVVSLAVAQVVAQEAEPEAIKPELPEGSPADTPWAVQDEKLFAAINDLLREIPLDGPRGLLVEAATKAEGRLESFRREVEAAFNDTMERASGWYKRKTQLAILVLSIAITIAMNVNTVTVAQRLWNDESLRSAVTSAAVSAANSASSTGANGSSASGTGGAVAIAQASGSASTTQKPATPTPSPGDKCAPAGGTPSAPPADPGACAKQKAEHARDALASIGELDLPLGWQDPNKPKLPGALLGWLLTIAALTFGAPFWFDALNRLVRLRSSGVPAAPDTSGAVGQPGASTTNSSSVPQELQRPRRG